MAAREDEPQAIVLDVLVEHGREVLGLGRQLLGQLVVERTRAPAHADAVDGLEAARRHEPGARVRGHAVARPLLDRGAKRLVQRFLGEVEIAEQADQRREHAPRFLAIDGVDRAAYVVHGPRASTPRWDFRES